MSNPSHILVADDERSIRLMLETGLTLNGFRVTCMRNGREALEPFQNKFDAVLSDIYMPDLGGLELVDALRAIDPNLPIVLMTAQGSVQVAVEAVSRGASDFIGKPFDISAVVDLLRRLLDARREADALPASEPELQLNQAGPGGSKRAHDRGLQADRAGRAYRSHGADSGRIRDRARNWWRAPSTISARAGRIPSSA